MFWAAARSYTEQGFKKVMARMKDMKPEAYEWLNSIGPELWARYTFSTDLKNDHITNNSSESFNAWIVKLRDKPVLTLMDTLRSKLMSKLQKRYQKACCWQYSMTPRVMKKLQKISQNARTMKFSYSGETTYQVKDEDVSYVVNTQERHCDCRIWDLTGIPCTHAAAVLLDRRQNLEDYCDTGLSKSWFLKTYSGIINPIPDVIFWPEFKEGEVPEVLPPELRRRSGRPKKSRKREDGEAPAVAQKRSCTLRCSRCMEFGHNQRTCAGGPKMQQKKTSQQHKKQVTSIIVISFNY